MSDQKPYSLIAFLGLVAQYRRTLKDGSQYDKYIPKADLSYDVLTNNGNVARTVQEMDKYCRQTLEDTAKLAPLLKGKTLPETLKNVFSFWFNHCQYKLDKDGVEELRRPRRAWHDGQILSRNPKTEPQAGIDCDCFSIAVGSCLMNLGINFKFRITKYNAGWQHVYVVVPVPNDGTSYYVIDCVLNAFNEEKTYTDKFDHTMNSPQTFLGGIPLARLGAIGDAVINVAQDKNDLISGCHFKGVEIDTIGAVEGNSPMLKSIYDHIVATRDIIRKEPDSMVIAGGAKAHLQMLDYAIAKWNTPERDAALDVLEKEEERWNQTTEKNGSVSGTDGAEEMEIGFTDENDELDGDLDELIEGLAGLGKLKIKKAGKTFFSNVKKSVKAVDKFNKSIVKKVAGQKAVDKIEKIQANAKVLAKKAGAVIKKFIVLSNPLTLAMRAGFLLAMKVNLFQWAQRAYPAYFSLQEANNMGITKAAWELSKKGRAALEKVFIGLGGSASKLEHYIKTGRAHKKLSGFGSLGYEPVTPTVIVSAAAALISASAGIAKAGMNNKSYAAAQKQHDEAVTKQTQIKYAKARAVHGLGEADEEAPPVDESNTPADTVSPHNEDAEVEAPEVTEEDAKDSKGGKFKHFVEAIKNFFSKKKNKGEAIETGADILTQEQNDSSDPSAAAENVEAVALQKSKEAQQAALAAGKTPAEALEAGKQAYMDAGGGSTDEGSELMSKIGDFVKANPVPTAIGTVVGIAALTLAFSPKARQAIGFGTKQKAKPAMAELGKVKHTKALLPIGTHIQRVLLK